MVVFTGMPLATKVMFGYKPAVVLTTSPVDPAVVLTMPLAVMASAAVMTAGAERVSVVPPATVVMLVMNVPARMPVPPLTGWPTIRPLAEPTRTVVPPTTLATLEVSAMLPLAVSASPEMMTAGLESVSTLPVIWVMVVPPGTPVPVMV